MQFLFTRKEIIVCKKFIYKFSLTLRRVKVSSLQGLNVTNLFLVMRDTHDLNNQKP